MRSSNLAFKLLVLSLHSTARLIQRRDTVHYFRQPRASGRQLPRLLQQAHQTLLQTRAKPGRQGRQAWQIVSVKDKCLSHLIWADFLYKKCNRREGAKHICLSCVGATVLGVFEGRVIRL